MKKTGFGTTALLCAALMLALVSCDGGTTDAETDGDTPGVGAVTQATAETLSPEDYAEFTIADAVSAYPDIPYVMQFTHDGSSDDIVTYDEYRYYQLFYKNYFDGGDDAYWTTNPDMLPKITDAYNKEILRNHAVLAECKKNGLLLTEEERAALDMENAVMAASFGTMEYFLECLDVYYMSTWYYNYYAELSTLYARLDAHYRESGQILTASADIRAMLDTDDYIRAKHILIKNDVGDDPAENRALAEELLGRIQEGEDFDALMNTYSEDTGLATNPDGYYFFYQEMDEAFASASFALKEGEMSGIVESSFGYHIILRCEKDSAYLDENLAAISAIYGDLRFYALLDAVYADWDIAYCDNYETLSDWHYAESMGTLYTK